MTNDPIEWLIDEGEEAVFDFGDALMVTCIPGPTLQNWVHRNHFKAIFPNPGTGNRRMYTAHNLVVLTIAHRLVVGLDVAAADAAAMALDIWIAVLSEVKKTRDISHLATAIAFIKSTPGEKRVAKLLTGAGANPFQELADGSPAIIFAVGVVIKQTAGRALETSSIAERPARYAKGGGEVTGGRPAPTKETAH